MRILPKGGRYQSISKIHDISGVQRRDRQTFMNVPSPKGAKLNRLRSQESISIRLLKKSWKVTTTTHNPQNLDTIIQNPVENDIASQRQSSEVGANCLIAFATIGESNELLTLVIEGTKEAIACFEAVFGKLVSNFVEISAGENVDNVAARSYSWVARWNRFKIWVTKVSPSIGGV